MSNKHKSILPLGPVTISVPEKTELAVTGSESKQYINRQCPYYESFNGKDLGCQLFGSFRCDQCTKEIRGD